MSKATKDQTENSVYPELFNLSEMFNQKVEVSFTVPDLSSQGGLLLLREFEQHTGFIHRVS